MRGTGLRYLEEGRPDPPCGPLTKQKGKAAVSQGSSPCSSLAVIPARITMQPALLSALRKEQIVSSPMAPAEMEGVLSPGGTSGTDDQQLPKPPPTEQRRPHVEPLSSSPSISPPAAPPGHIMQPALLAALRNGPSSEEGDRSSASLASSLTGINHQAAALQSLLRPLRFDNGNARIGTGSNTSSPVTAEMKQFEKLIQNPKSFTDLMRIAEDRRPVTVTIQMRALDCLRFYRPSEEEREILGVTRSTERLSLHVTEDVIALCGGRRGVRFSTQEVKQFSSWPRALEAVFLRVDDSFKELPGSLKRAVLQKNNGNALYAEGEELSPFVNAANQYLDGFKRLHTFISTKRNALAVEAGTAADVTGEVREASDEDTATASKALPEFLELLSSRYRSHFGMQPWLPGTGPVVNSLGHFSRFLAGCATAAAELTEAEQSALAYLLDMSVRTHDPAHTEKLTSRQLARKIFRFLSTVRELRTVPKDEAAINAVTSN